MAANGHDGPGGEPESRNEVPQSSAPKTPLDVGWAAAGQVALIVLALVVLGWMIASAGSGCSANCVSYP